MTNAAVIQALTETLSARTKQARDQSTAKP